MLTATSQDVSGNGRRSERLCSGLTAPESLSSAVGVVGTAVAIIGTAKAAGVQGRSRRQVSNLRSSPAFDRVREALERRAAPLHEARLARRALDARVERRAALARLLELLAALRHSGLAEQPVAAGRRDIAGLAGSAGHVRAAQRERALQARLTPDARPAGLVFAHALVDAHEASQRIAYETGIALHERAACLTETGRLIDADEAREGIADETARTLHQRAAGLADLRRLIDAHEAGERVAHEAGIALQERPTGLAEVRVVDADEARERIAVQAGRAREAGTAGLAEGARRLAEAERAHATVATAGVRETQSAVAGAVCDAEADDAARSGAAAPAEESAGLARGPALGLRGGGQAQCAGQGQREEEQQPYEEGGHRYHPTRNGLPPRTPNGLVHRLRE